MSEKELQDKPVASAQKLYSFLSLLPKQTSLDSYQHEALNQDIRTIEHIISKLNEADSKEDWRTIWRMVQEWKRTLGGYVGDDLGYRLTQLVEDLWRDVLDSYSESTR